MSAVLSLYLWGLARCQLNRYLINVSTTNESLSTLKLFRNHMQIFKTIFEMKNYVGGLYNPILRLTIKP